MSRRHWRALLASVALAAAACTASPPARAHPVLPLRTATQAGTPLRILAVGDSRTGNGAWVAELSRLLTASGVDNTTDVAAVGGTTCFYWTDKIAGLLAQYRPDVVYLACGTNDSPADTIYGEPRTGWALRYIAEAVHAYGARFVPALVQYSDPILAPAWLLANEPQTNDSLYRQFHYYQAPARVPPWWVAAADFQVIPSTASYLVAEPYPGDPAGSIGIHPNARGYRYMGRIAYDAGAANGLWPPTAEPPLCDLYGHRNGYPRPAYTPC